MLCMVFTTSSVSGTGSSSSTVTPDMDLMGAPSAWAWL